MMQKAGRLGFQLLRDDQRLRTDQELADEMIKALGFKRRGAWIDEAIRKAIAQALAIKICSQNSLVSVPSIRSYRDQRKRYFLLSLFDSKAKEPSDWALSGTGLFWGRERCV